MHDQGPTLIFVLSTLAFSNLRRSDFPLKDDSFEKLTYLVAPAMFSLQEGMHATGQHGVRARSTRREGRSTRREGKDNTA